jgi:hypothetical protein
MFALFARFGGDAADGQPAMCSTKFTRSMEMACLRCTADADACPHDVAFESADLRSLVSRRLARQDSRSHLGPCNETNPIAINGERDDQNGKIPRHATRGSYCRDLAVLRPV